ncbi:NAD(P)/FAD-dependent oxidoreductase [Candidatus Leptofilum sp.]|uniref:NAD(P)/FAD-dependent oxidoreductase n=1 Tax=Candidatus Leptofilum sp. TaxID=3241576 RepID=UPI003B5BE61F
MNNQQYDVVFVGGGVMGCAIATNLLLRDPQLNVALVEKDLSYKYSSTVLSDGNSRVQFNVKENIQMSLYALEVLDSFAEDMAVDGEKPEVGFRQQGNLFLTDEAGRTEVAAGLALQQRLGGNVSWLTPSETKAVFPMLNIEAGLFAGTTFGRDDGTMLPQAVLEAYKKKAVSLGAHLLEAEVTAVRHQSNQVTGVQLKNGDVLSAGIVVNSAGGWGTQIAQTCGVELPMEPVMRQVYIIETAVRSQNILPLLLLPSGTYLIHEGHGLFMCGRSFADDPITTTDFSWQRSRFEERLWPELVDFLPSFDSLRVTDGWAGIYAVNTFDGNAILGEWPELRGFYLVNGFSGHGFQQCHAVGRYLAECILGLPPTLDLAIFSPHRILENAPVFENQQKLI